MKKIMMTAAIGALCATVAFGEGVTSGIVGYQAVALPANGTYGLYTPTFKDVGGATTIDLTEISVIKTNATSFTSKTKVRVQKMDLTTGGLTSTYAYTTAGNKWKNISSNADVEVGEVTFQAGEAMCVYNGDSAGADLAFQFSGAVELAPVSLNIAPSNYTLVGNMTPVAVDLTAIVPKGENGGDLGTSKTKIRVQKMSATTGGLTTTYAYTTAGNKWKNINESVDVAVGDVVFAPGEAMCVYNGDTKVVSLSFPSPVSE